MNQMLFRSPLPLLLALAFAVGACGDDPSGPGSPDPTYGGAAIVPVETNVNSAAIVVTATGYDAVRVRLRTDGEPDELSPPVAFDGGLADVSALGMLAERDYRIDVLLLDGQAADSVETLEMTTGPLPDWIPDLATTGTPAEDGYIGLAHPRGGLVVDNQGRVRWYVESEDPVLNNFMAHPSGEYTLYGTDDADRVYRVLDERGHVTRQLACADGLSTRFHEVRVLPGGDYWALCDEEIETDLSSRGGAVDAVVTWTVLQHLSEDGALLYEFRTSEHFSLDDIDPSQVEGAEAVNMTHGNVIEFDDDGTVLVSFRSLNEITKIDVEADEVVWRLGGRANQFLVDDPTRTFERQHGVRLAGPELIQLLDNGSSAPSRLARYTFDEDAMTAALAFEYAHPSGAFTPVGGNTDVVAGGGALVSFGRAGRVTEVDASGAPTFELTGLEGEYIFRAFRVPSLYATERRAP